MMARVRLLEWCCVPFVLAWIGLPAATGRPPLPPVPLRHVVNPPVGAAARQRDLERLEYHFTPGQTFAYSVDIEIERLDATKRFYGTPVFTVRSAEPDGASELLAVGRLGCFLKLRGGTGYSAMPADDVEIGTRVVLGNPEDGGHGKEDVNEKALPNLFSELVGVKKLMFVELPAMSTGHFGHEGSADLMRFSMNGLLGMTNQTIPGREKLMVSGELESASVVRLIKERSFRAKDGNAFWQYQGTSRFDRQRGLVLSNDATYSWEEGADKGDPATIQVRLLEGEDFAKAQEQAQAVWAQMPADQQPKELLRQRLDVRTLPRLSTGRDVQPGMEVAHFSDNDNHWYLADVVVVIADYKVQIRYRGTEEEVEAHPGQLAIPPAGVRVIDPVKAPAGAPARQAEAAASQPAPAGGAVAAKVAAKEKPEPTPGASWLPYVVFGVVAVPCFLLLLVSFGRRRQF